MIVSPRFLCVFTSTFVLAFFPFPGFSQEAEKPKKPLAVSKIFLAEPNGSGGKLLTASAAVEEYQKQGSPTFSRDGKLVAFDAWRPQLGETYADARIILANADGSNPRVLIDGAMPSFSPKGKRIAFSRYSTGNSTWIVDAQDPQSELVQLNDGWGADWSPDGHKIAFTSHAGGSNLGIVDLIEGETWYIFEEGKSPYRFIYWNTAWSPDSQRIVFKGIRPEGSEEIAIVDVRGAKHGYLVRFKEKTSNAFCWRPDGRILVAKNDAATRRRLLFSFGPNDDKPLELLPGLDTSLSYDDPAVASDGKRLAYSLISQQ